MSGSGSRVDLSVADDVPIRDLLPELLVRCEPKARPWSRWALGPPRGEPFSPRRTLAELDVLDGAELELIDMAEDAGHGLPGPPSDPSDVLGEPGEDSVATRREHRRRVVGLVERVVDDLGNIRAGRNPILDYAIAPVRARLRGLAPAPLDPAPRREMGNLGLTVRWPSDPRALVAAVATLTETVQDPSGLDTTAAPAQRVTLRLLVDPHHLRVIDATVSVEAAVR